MKPTTALLALAVVAVTARLLRKRHAAPPPQSDDSEVVGMPTTWAWDDALSDTATRSALAQGLLEAASGRTNSWTLGYDNGYVIRHGLFGPYIETAPTSDN